MLNRQSGKYAINEHLLILGVDGGSIDKAGVENIEAVGDVFVDNEGDLIVEVFGSGYKGVDRFGDGLRGDEGFVDFGLFAAEEFEVETVVGEFEEAVVVVDGGFEEGVGGWGLDLSLLALDLALLPVFELEGLCGFGFFELFYNALVGRVVDRYLASVVVLALAVGGDLDCAHWRLHCA